MAIPSVGQGKDSIKARGISTMGQDISTTGSTECSDEDSTLGQDKDDTGQQQHGAELAPLLLLARDSHVGISTIGQDISGKARDRHVGISAMGKDKDGMRNSSMARARFAAAECYTLVVIPVRQLTRACVILSPVGIIQAAGG